MPQKREQDGLGPILPGSNGKRPPPPAELNPREKVIWRDIAKRLPADWFQTSQPVLKELCQHIRLADDLMEDVRRAQAVVDELRGTPGPADVKLLVAALRELRAALRAHLLQSGQIISLSTKLRLTPQSRYAPSTAKVRAGETSDGIEPWNDWGNDPPVQ
jgi:hypothetical protein